MSKTILFHLSDCPYCHNARRALEELCEENPEYREIHIDWIEESENPDISAQYDYYYVPTVFVDGRKAYEAHPGESYADCRRNLQRVLESIAR